MEIKKIIAASLKNSGHYFDVNANILYLSMAFQKNSNIYGTREYHLLNRILTQFPSVCVEVVKPKAREALTYKLMENYISIMPNAASNFAEYKRIKLQSHAYRSAYKFVSEWFKKKFPNYDKLLERDDDGNLTWNVLDNYNQAQAEAAERIRNAAEGGDA